MAGASEELKVLGKRIQAARKSLGLTQQELAEKLSFDKTTIASWETGRREPELKPLIKVADMSGVGLDWLTGRYEYDINKAKEYNKLYWREIIDLAADNGITPQLLRPAIEAIVAIKKS